MSIADVVGLDATLGLELVAVEPDHARGRVAVADHLRQRWGFVHGGVYACLAGTLAFEATAGHVAADGMMPIGLSNDTSFVRPVRDGFVHATARPRHRGRTTWIWDVDITDDDDRLCALARVTVAIRPRPVDP